MTWHEFLDDDLREQAALFVLGSLEGEEERRYRLHLPACDACRAEVEGLALTARSLVHASPESAPSPALWDRVLARVRAEPRAADEGDGIPPRADAPAEAQVWKRWGADASSSSGFVYAKADAGAFEPTGFAGVEARRLFVDAANDRVTMLVRMAAGTSYPGHRHRGVEECFVLAGDLRVGDLHMRAGDYQRAAAGSRHVTQSTDAGCLLLLVSSLGDEIA